MRRLGVFLTAMLLATGFLQAQSIGGTVYGGGRMAAVDCNAKVEMKGGTVTGSLYGGNDISGSTGNTSTAETDYGVIVTGGTVTGNVFGGANGYYGCHGEESSSPIDYTSDFDGDDVSITTSATTIPTISKTYVKINGGTVSGSVYGGGNLAPIGHSGTGGGSGSVEVSIVQGTINGNVFTGGNMASVYVPTSLTVNNETSTDNFASLTITGGVYGGNDKSGNVVVNRTNVLTASDGVTSVPNTATYVKILGAPSIGSVFGASNGKYNYDGDGNYIPEGSSVGLCNLQVPHQTSSSFVDINTKGGYIDKVFGGGNSAQVASTTVLLNTQTESSSVNNGDHNGLHVGTVYGGCNLEDVNGSTYILQKQSKVSTIYGGCNISGNINEATHVTVSGGTVTDAVFGGANGYYGCAGVNGKYANDFDEHDGVTVSTLIDMPTVKTSNVTISGGTIESANVYGGGNLAPLGNSTDKDGIANVTISGGNISGNVYGGGNMASVYGITNVSVSGTPTVNGNVFGGNDKAGTVTGTSLSASLSGRGTASNGADVNAASFVKITGNPAITRVFGGGNGDYYVGSDYTPDPSGSTSNCTLNAPTISSTFVDLNMNASSNKIDEAYAGGNNATVTSKATILLNEDNSSTAAVTTIFGGNNKATMSILPTINLVKGSVENVYGGGNAGNMMGSDMSSIRDAAGNVVEYVSTYVKVATADVKVTGTLYGGCKAANVYSTAYVDVQAGEVQNLYGGNDIAGTVNKARVDVTGGTILNIFGGSNGYYTYTTNADDNTKFDVYPFGTNTDRVATKVVKPFCTSTDVNIWGGIIGTDAYPANVYAGGNAGDCGDTYLEIDDSKLTSHSATITGKIFGGGNGVLNCGSTDANPRVGNVTGTAHTDLKHLTELKSATVYGGGNAGNVGNTMLTLYDTWEKPFDYIYGGCNAADVTGAAHTLIRPRSNSRATAEVIYGGNDVSGVVANTLLEVNGGGYTNLFGGGNGNYNYSTDYSGCSVPISEDVTVVINEGNFTGNVYGGGNLGKCGRKELMTSPDDTLYNTDPTAYGRISLNIHGGTYNNIFTGGKGNTTSGQVVFGLKQLNMDGGTVSRSVYGGSELVNDGYPKENFLTEQISAGATPETTYVVDKYTLRPSTIMNIVGGTIKNNVYGGGYLGTIYGSVYVNIGKKAVDECVAWKKSYTRMNGTSAATPDDSTYAAFKPLWSAASSTTDSNVLVPHDLFLEKSVFNGSDWGEAGENAVFDTRGFVGGESYIVVDGQGYNTHFSFTGTSLPSMNIAHSLYGSGTSCEGGDKGRHIQLLNYGEYSCANNLPNVSKELKSIQRADDLLIHNSYVRLTGTQDNFSAYVSSTYGVSRVSDWRIQGHTFVTMAAPTLYVHKLSFLKEDGTVNNDRSGMRTALGGADSAHCDLNNSLCELIPRGSTFPMFYIEDGVFVDVIRYSDSNAADYGEISGYAYLLAAAGTRINVIARKKDNDLNQDDGGFFFVCNYNNTWHPLGETDYEYPYTNYASGYRSWNFGDDNGSRKRQVTIVAHANPDKLTSNRLLGAQDTSSSAGATKYTHFALATAKLVLPPTETGHYYNITGINIDLSNGGQLTLAKETYDPDTNVQNSQPHWIKPPNSGSESYRRKDIADDPTYTFGLMFELGQNFSTDTTAAATTGQVGRQTECVVWGNNNFSALNGFYSTAVTDANSERHTNVIPTLNFYLTYSTEFSSTILRDLTFTMMEKDTLGRDVAPIDVTVTISTIVADFKDEKFSVMAMYNEGVTNEYTHKVLLPATLNKRELYLNRVQVENIGGTGDTNDFKLKNNSITSSAADLLLKDQFGFSVQLTEDLTQSINSTLGWYEHEKDPIEIFDLVSRADSQMVVSCDTTIRPGELGWQIGTLDGRSPAAVNVSLWYNGNVVFPKAGNIAKITLTFKWKQGTTTGAFDFICSIKTRIAGDTIYIASAGSVTRNGCMVTPYNDGSDGGTEGSNISLKGKSPTYYVQSFTDALSSNVYQEGDVLCILDTVKLGYKDNVVIRGGEYGMLQLVRYTGRHYEFPGEDCAYRGPMIVLNQDAKFSSYNMRIDGGGICKTLQKYTSDQENKGNLCPTATSTATPKLPADGGYYYEKGDRIFDTTLSAGPIFNVRDNATLTLADKVDILYNFNKRSSVTTTAGQYDGGGAIVVQGGYNYTPQIGWANAGTTPAYDTNSATAAPTVYLNNNIHIYENGVYHASDNHAANANQGAAIYNNGGKLIVGNYADGAVINIYDNYYVQAWDGTDGIISGSATTKFTWTPPAGVQRNNIYLTRTAPATDDATVKVMKDNSSDMVTFLTDITEGSKVGISKWFPGPACRDTIQAAKVGVTNQLYATNAAANKVFVSDSSQYDVFYHSSIEPYKLFLHRCATFREQKLGGDTLYADRIDTKVPQRAPLEYGYDSTAACPTSHEALYFNVHGGFYPYTFIWKDNATSKTLDSVVTPYNNAQVHNEMKDTIPGSLKAQESNRGTYMMDNVSMGFQTSDSTYKYKVSAYDLAGCMHTRDIEVRLVKTRESEFHDSRVLGRDTAISVPGVVQTVNWNDTTMTADTAKALHVYKGININSQVLPVTTPSIATITGKINGSSIANLDISASNHDKLAFCEGDVIQLYTTSNNATKHKFVMWDFDPNQLQGSDSLPIQYVVRSADDTIQAIYGATNYWKNQVHTFPSSGYTTNYNGSVHITTKEGLAWLISTVNGLNYQTANSFLFDTVYLEPASGVTEWNMSEYLWTPIGTPNHPFRGRFYVPNNLDDDPSNDLIIKGITVNEPNMQQVGFFGVIDTARIHGLKLHDVVLNGAQYGGAVAGVAQGAMLQNSEVSGDTTYIASDYVVGSMVGQSAGSKMDGNKVTDSRLLGSTVYGGGMLGNSCGDTVQNSEISNVNMSSLNTLYSGGIAGGVTGGDVCPYYWDADSVYSFPTSNDTLKGLWINLLDTTIWMNTKTMRPFRWTDNPCDPCPYVWDEQDWHTYYNAQQQLQRIKGCYIDTRTNQVVLNDTTYSPLTQNDQPCKDWPDPDANPTTSDQDNGAKGPFTNSRIENNMVNYIAPKSALYSGGLIGTATNTRIQNNYAYGSSDATQAAGALVGRAVEQVDVMDCYYLEGRAGKSVGTGDENSTLSRVYHFSGTGNQVVVDSVTGVNNLTRLLNRWVQKHGTDRYRTWRSAVGDENSGYPVFGEPDFITVSDTMNRTLCDHYDWNDTTYYESGVYSQFFHDTVEHIDSTMTLFLTLNESMLTQFFDSVKITEDYSGHGFYVNATELSLLRRTVEEQGSAQLIVADTLSTFHGCDSIVELHLAVYADSTVHISPVAGTDVKVYPNPTAGEVFVEAAGLTSVEVYDNVSRLLMQQQGMDDRCCLDISALPAGYYYLRIHAAYGTVIKKVVKR